MRKGGFLSFITGFILLLFIIGSFAYTVRPVSVKAFGLCDYFWSDLPISSGENLTPGNNIYFGVEGQHVTANKMQVDITVSDTNIATSTTSTYWTFGSSFIQNFEIWGVNIGSTNINLVLTGRDLSDNILCQSTIDSWIQVNDPASSGNYTISVSPSQQMVYLNGSAVWTVEVSCTIPGGYVNNLSFSDWGQFSGYTTSFGSNSVNCGNSTTLTISASAGASPTSSSTSPWYLGFQVSGQVGGSGTILNNNDGSVAFIDPNLIDCPDYNSSPYNTSTYNIGIASSTAGQALPNITVGDAGLLTPNTQFSGGSFLSQSGVGGTGAYSLISSGGIKIRPTSFGSGANSTISSYSDWTFTRQSDGKVANNCYLKNTSFKINDYTYSVNSGSPSPGSTVNAGTIVYWPLTITSQNYFNQDVGLYVESGSFPPGATLSMCDTGYVCGTTKKLKPSVGGSVTGYVKVDTTGASAGTYGFKVSAKYTGNYADNNKSAASNLTLTINTPVTPPTVTITSPTAGAQVVYGNSQSVVWTSTNTSGSNPCSMASDQSGHGPWSNKLANDSALDTNLTWDTTYTVTCNNLTGWQNRKKITFNNSASTENLVNFPVLIQLNSGNIDYSKTKNAGEDIRFVDPSDATTVLSHEIESWNESGTSYVWVKVPQIDSGSATDYIWMYYNNPSASDGQNVSGTWNSNYKLVWHLKETVTDEGAASNVYIDSTGNTNHGTQQGPDDVSALLYKGQYFDGTNDYINGGSQASLDDLTQKTISVWARRPSINTASMLVKKAGDDGTYLGWDMHLRSCSSSSNGPCKVRFSQGWNGTAFSWAAWYGSTNINSSTAWYNIAVSYDRSLVSNDPKIYVNGAADTVTEIAAPAGTVRSDSAVNVISGYDELFSSTPHTGELDEIRISNVIRSAEWLEAEYLYSKDNTKYTYGTEEGYTSVGWCNDTVGITCSATAVSGSSSIGVVVIPNPPSNIKTYNTNTDPTNHPVPCGQIKITWNTVTGADGYYLYTSPAGASVQTVTGGSTGFTFYATTNSETYYVASFANFGSGIKTSSRVVASPPPNQPITPIPSPCRPNLVNSDLDILTIDGVSVTNASHCDSTPDAVLPGQTYSSREYLAGAVVRYRLNLCNNGTISGNNIVASVKLSNLSQPAGGWNFQVSCGGCSKESSPIPTGSGTPASPFIWDFGSTILGVNASWYILFDAVTTISAGSTQSDYYAYAYGEVNYNPGGFNNKYNSSFVHFRVGLQPDLKEVTY